MSAKEKIKFRDMVSSVSVKMIMIMMVMILPLNVIVLVYTHNMERNIAESIRFDSQKKTEYMMQSLSNTMDNAKALLTHFVTKDADCIYLKNADISDYEKESSRLKLHYKIRSMASMTNGADGYFYDYQGQDCRIVYANADKKSEMSTRIQIFLDEYSSGKDRKGWTIQEWNGNKYLLFLISDQNLLYGAAIRLEPFLKGLSDAIAYPVQEMELSERGLTEYETGMENARVISVQADADRIVMRLRIDKNEVLNTFTLAQKFLIGISILYLVLIPILYSVFRILFIKPLQQVNRAHQQIESGNGQYRITEKVSTTEYRNLYQSFNRMADSLHQLKIEGYEKEIAKQKMELRNLQLQIRPHFLLNTFNLIFTLSQRKAYDAIQEIVIYLSDYFRYIFRSEKELELFAKEAALIRGYVKMASVRYSGRVEAEYDFPQELSVVRMPPLLIHNFVENAVKYGVRQNRTLHIRIQAFYEAGMVTFRITDDGKGMNPEVLEQNRKIFREEIDMEDKNSHIGLYNSLKRLKYFYGEGASIEVESEEGKGTCFTIRFPYDEV